jgi:HAD superfamily hydrolase (TIGR01509 family)
MIKAPEALIFDMDGVLIDSEPLWRKAMIQGFGEAGLPFTEEDCRKTTGQRFTEVVQYWVTHHPHISMPAPVLEDHIVTILLSLIEKEGQTMPGIEELIAFCSEHRLRMGLATSSAERLMKAVLKKLKLEDHFYSAISAQFMTHGKPHPEVFLVCAHSLGVKPADCWVIEDSVNGVIAAKAAQMTTLAVPDPEFRSDPRFSIADFTCSSMNEVIPLLSGFLSKNLLKHRQ